MESKYIDDIIQNSVTFAKDKGHEYVTLEHIMFCLLENSDITELVRDLHVDINNIVEDLNQFLDDPDLNGLVNEHGIKGDPKKTVSTERMIQRALAQVIFSGRDEVKPLDIFISILNEQDTHASYFCSLNGLDKNIIVDVANATIIIPADNKMEPILINPTRPYLSDALPAKKRTKIEAINIKEKKVPLFDISRWSLKSGTTVRIIPNENAVNVITSEGAITLKSITSLGDIIKCFSLNFSLFGKVSFIPPRIMIESKATIDEE